MTIRDCLDGAAQECPDNVALRYKQDGRWRTMSFQQLRERVWHVAEMLVRIGVGPGDRVALYRENSTEWFEIYHGIVSIGAIAVPVDAKLREQEVAHIFHDCGVSAVFCSGRMVPVVDAVSERLIHLKAVVAIGGGEELSLSRPEVRCVDYDRLREEVAEDALGDGRAYDRFAPEEDVPASFIYTSGTTGRQKGAVLSHRNFMANVVSIAEAIDIRPSDNFMLVLPLHHSFAFTCNLLVPLYARCEISLVENLKTIKANMADCSPTVLLAVPLLLEKMLSRIMDGIAASKPATWMYRLGLARVIGRKIHAGLGGALRIVVSGGAPISASTLEVWNKLGILVVEGYGITETAPVLTVNRPDGPVIGTVGPPLSGVEIRIDHPNGEGVGEIVVRGDNVMQGYYNNPEETAKVLNDGWYFTGDLGRVDAAGYLTISGRKKSLIVNREGKNIYPEEVERQVLRSRYALECLALGYCEAGDAGERVGLIVVPNVEVFNAIEDREGKRFSDDEIEQILREDVRHQLKALSDYKRPRRIEVRFEEFEKTTTQKIKRYLYAINTATA
ncbi:MAG: AMP-binding protein [Pontiellaceae bacterium]|nr:AMP-binding protein [Pontiellaceae bacterium]MBN2785716.1 AMP-binding protein [Pontiellaceae bacterium]